MDYQKYIHPEKKEYLIYTDPSFFNIEFIHQFLTNDSYWAKDTGKKETEEKINDELCFGVFYKKEQIGFASVTSDYFNYAYISDVFIDEKYTGRGLATWLMNCILSHPQLINLSNWMLLTDDAHGLYEKIGFEKIKGSADKMIKYNRTFK